MLSNKETEMFLKLGFTQEEIGRQRVLQLYHNAVLKVFYEDLQGSAVESLRRCYRECIVDMKQIRLTPEFDNLIDLR